MAIPLNAVLVLITGALGDMCAGINAAGWWLLSLGLVTLALGAFHKTVPRRQLFLMCLAMVFIGLLMISIL